MVGTVEEVAAGEDVLHRVLSLLQRYGWNATSFQCLEPGVSYWFDPAGDACVAYVDTKRAWVAAGAPIAPENRLEEVALRFLEAATAAGRRCCFFATERRFATPGPLCSLQIGEQPVWDPQEWEPVLQSSRSLREQLRRARAKGVEVRPLASSELAVGTPLRDTIEQLITRWLGSRPMAPMGFLVQVHPFSFPDERRFFLAEKEGQVVGFLAMVPVYARDGWLLEDLLRDPSAPNGTAELLVDAGMRAAAAEGSRYATLGLSPLTGGVSGWLDTVRRYTRGLYDFEGVHAFKAKLKPAGWHPIHLSYPAGEGSVVGVIDSLAAFSCGGLLRFGIDTLVHAPAVGLRFLAYLLVPWTAMLALAATSHWFPARWVQVGWTLFDVFLVLALLSLAARWRDWLGRLLAVLITGDAVLTWWEAVTFNFRPGQGGWVWVISLLACLAPTGAAIFLWHVLARRGGLSVTNAADAPGEPSAGGSPSFGNRHPGR